MTWSMPKLAAGGLLAAALAGVAGSSTTAAAQAATPRCTTGGLAVWVGVGPGGAQAGSTSYPLELTNVSGRTCHLFGFPGVSALAGKSQAGSAAGRDRSAPEHTVTLRPGATAHAVLRIADVSAFPPGTCRPVAADALKVYPPGAFRAATVPFRFRACSAKGPVFLHVTAVQPRVGVPGHP
jgi:Protein of unknown function (DUF4232)